MQSCPYFLWVSMGIECDSKSLSLGQARLAGACKRHHRAQPLEKADMSAPKQNSRASISKQTKKERACSLAGKVEPPAEVIFTVPG